MWIEERLCDVKRGCVCMTQVFWTAGQLLFFGTVWQCHCLDRSELYLLRIKKIVLKSDVASGGVLLSPRHYLSERHSPWSLNTNHHNIMMSNIWCMIWIFETYLWVDTLLGLLIPTITLSWWAIFDVWFEIFGHDLYVFCLWIYI